MISNDVLDGSTQPAHDPFDHDGFIVSVKRNLFEASALAVHPDGEFICRAVRRHRSLAKAGYWLAASALIALGLVGIVAVLTQASSSVQALVTVFVVVFLIISIVVAARFAPHSAVVILLDQSDRLDAIPALALKRGTKFSVFGDVSTMLAEGEGEIGRMRRYGTNSSTYSLAPAGDAGVRARFVPERNQMRGAVLASMLGPLGVIGALFIAGKPASAWSIVISGGGPTVGSLVTQRSTLGDYVLDLTDDVERAIDRRVVTLAALTALLNRSNAT